MTRDAHEVPRGYAPCRIADGRFAELVGPLYVREGEPLRFGFRAGAHHGNVRAAVHGGMLMTLADQVLGLTVMHAVGLRTPVVTVSLSCDFVAAAMPGDWIEGEASVTRAARSLVFVRGCLFNERGVVLSAAGVWKKLDRAQHPHTGRHEGKP